MAFKESQPTHIVETDDQVLIAYDESDAFRIVKDEIEYNNLRDPDDLNKIKIYKLGETVPWDVDFGVQVFGFAKSKKPAKKKRNLTPEGRKALSAAAKRMWRARRKAKKKAK